MSNDKSPLKVGFIGLGRMGCGMASNLVRKGFSLKVFDLNTKAVGQLIELGAIAAKDVADASSDVDVIITMLPNTAVVLELIGGINGVLANAKAGAIVMDMSTVEPEATDQLAAAALAQGKSFVDAPVGRLASHADRGESLFMVGGTEADFAKVTPLLEAMGTTIHHCGVTGTGTRTKIVNNYLAVVSCQLNAEALTLSQRFGLSLEKTLDVIYGTTATNGQLKIAWPDKVLKGDIAPGFTIDLAHKDLTLIVGAANSAKSPMPIGAAAREAFSTARARGFGGNDFSAMVDVLCELSNTEKPRLKK
ncbi:NAD(P)-binding domain-containing protein [Herbaspirillum sp. RTI4]|uniref:NAD(P)-dependent oxidoreductase n=1 Tax=Herbaspirillum sp. RTI4 TaxID=3048640 RepID=UPI002AB5C280|nr:NAD(P)-binding domain-containing protein [Herbaspirillum sp. RTI4]MDY7579931.1 NAD(P)-binding domain-containing protein [Herbaspirillum sp. RTI4]MEA9983324.1 NAD(P)-binding domain-containing protein [Herbaspirillum sp. RTI4]